MESLQTIFERICKINWFYNCGNEICNMDITHDRVKNWKEAVRKCKGTTWENTQLEASNSLTMALSRDWREKYRMWNDITDQAKELFMPVVIPIISEYVNGKALDISVLHCVQWDILAAMMEYVYSPYVRPGFYMELLKVYEAGHFPCGWKGKWPDGNLIIY